VAVLTLISIYLTFRVIKQRKIAKVAIGDCKNPALKGAITVHNNFTQYVPFVYCSLRFLKNPCHPNTCLYMIRLLAMISLSGKALHLVTYSNKKHYLC
jgi:uncharacterized membrane protein YecN with MAPEG domain